MLEYTTNCGNFLYDCETGLQSAPAEIFVGYANKSFITPTIDNKNLFFPQVAPKGVSSCDNLSLPITQTIGGNSIYKNICNACCCVYLSLYETRCREGENNTAAVYVEVGYNPLGQRGLYPKILEFGGFPNGPIILNVDRNNPTHYVWVDSLEEGSYEFYVRDLTYNSITDSIYNVSTRNKVKDRFIGKFILSDSSIITLTSNVNNYLFHFKKEKNNITLLEKDTMSTSILGNSNITFFETVLFYNDVIHITTPNFPKAIYSITKDGDFTKYSFYTNPSYYDAILSSISLNKQKN